MGITLRFRTKYGMFRAAAEHDSEFSTVLQQLDKIPPGQVTVCDSPNGNFKPVQELFGKSVGELGFKNGELLFLNVVEDAPPAGTVATGTVPMNQSVAIPKRSRIVELPLDTELGASKGLIPRSKSNLCKHNDKGMCEYCSPLPPWDESYKEEQGIKHISFHSYLKKLDHQTNKGQGSSYIAPLEQPNYKINKQCAGGHEPWPRGICSKCQPSAITLQQQEFRMVDHVEFISSDVINEFIESWRATGDQRFGYMYGSYEKYDRVPLGIKAVVHAIYEPPQLDENDGITLHEDNSIADKLAKELGLVKVGVIFTDLTDAGNGGKVLCKRHKDSFFLSSLEVCMAARLQKLHPNITKHSDSGEFSSKFVTCVVSGNLQGEIDVSSYQVSASCEALVDADLISPSTHPSLAYINNTDQNRYVPEIFYMKQNEYKVVIKENAKPAFPVEYLLVSLTHGFPTEATVGPQSFPIENRAAHGVSQDMTDIKRVLVEDNLPQLMLNLGNFHLLLYLFDMDILSPQDCALVARIAREQDIQLVYELIQSPSWRTLMMILEN